MNEPKTDIDFPLCPHCGEESIDDDDLCRFCGKVMVATAQEGGCARALRAGLLDLKTKIRPLTANELDELFDKTTFNLSNPADPIWDD